MDKVVHGELMSHLENTERKIGKWTEAAIREKILRETKKKKPNG